MKRKDFRIGLIFQNAIGRWKCTDLGTRTIAAIHLEDPAMPEDAVWWSEKEKERWIQGPPYGLQEHVFDERAMDAAFLDTTDELLSRVRSMKKHPNRRYPASSASESFSRRFGNKSTPERNYPTRRLLGIRVRRGEEIVIDSARREKDGTWTLFGFNFDQQKPVEIKESEWFSLPFADDQPEADTL